MSRLKGRDIFRLSGDLLWNWLCIEFEFRVIDNFVILSMWDEDIYFSSMLTMMILIQKEWMFILLLVAFSVVHPGFRKKNFQKDSLKLEGFSRADLRVKISVFKSNYV